jgi:phospholipid/cholesterol/gamma-HCH transport system substrate-binding protein
MNRTSVFRGVAAAVVLLSASALVLDTSGEESKDRTVRATIADAGALEKGNDVRVSGVLVGSIGDIELRGAHAVLTLSVDPGVLPLHQDASLKVRPVNLLGESFVDLDPGSDSEPFMERAVIPMSRAEYGVTLQDVLNTFRQPTAAGLAAVLTTLGEGVADSGDETAAAIKALAATMQQTEALGNLLSAQNQTLDGLVTKLDPVSRAIATDKGAVLDRLIGSTRKTLAAVTAEHQALEQTMVELPGTLASARRTLATFAGAAEAGTPTLKAVRPLTGDLEQVTAELRRFADAADPALASLQPVLEHAQTLLEEAAPAVAQLRQAGPSLRRTARSARPLGAELLDAHLEDLMAFVRKWALSTNGRDAISHYFRGVAYVTPNALKDLATSLVPRGVGVPKPKGPKASTGPTAPGLLSGLGLDLPKLLSPLNATGLTSQQEQNLVGQLLGGLL